MTYILKTGKHGLERLKSVNHMYNKESDIFIKKSNLRKGMIIIDAGCGSGLMSIKLAKLVGNKGKVIAIDQSEEQIEIAKCNSKRFKLNNIEYIKDDLKNLQSYNFNADALYSRLVLVHQKDPAKQVKIYLSALKAGGLLLCEEPITSTSFSLPKSDYFLKHLSLYMKMGKAHLLNFDLGKQLQNLFELNNISVLLHRKIQNTFSDLTSKNIAYLRTLECSDIYLKNKLVSNKALDILLTGLLELSNDKFSIVSGVEMVQIIGKKLK